MFTNKFFTKKAIINAKRYEHETTKLVEEQKAKLNRIAKLTPIELEQEKKNTEAKIQRSNFECSKILQDNKIENLKLKTETEKLKFELQNFRQKDTIKRAKLELKQHEEIIAKSSEYEKISTLCTVMSILMTVGGILFMKGCTTINELFKQGTVTYIAVATIIVMQLSIIKCNKDQTIREKYFFNQIPFINILKYITISTSMFCNFYFLRSFGFTTIVSLSLAIGLDINSLICASIATDFKFRNYSFRQLDGDIGLLNMLIFILTSKFKKKLKYQYDMELKTYKNMFNDTSYNYSPDNSSIFNKISSELELNTSNYPVASTELPLNDIEKTTDKKIVLTPDTNSLSDNISTVKKSNNHSNTAIPLTHDTTDNKKNNVTYITRNNSKIDTARERLKNLSSGTRINKSALGRMTETEYRKIRKILKNEGLLLTTNNATYVK